MNTINWKDVLASIVVWLFLAFLAGSGIAAIVLSIMEMPFIALISASLIGVPWLLYWSIEHLDRSNRKKRGW